MQTLLPSSMHQRVLIRFVVAAFVVTAPHRSSGETRSSDDYRVVSESMDFGGRSTASTSYSGSASILNVAGSAATSPVTATLKVGYVGQLYEVESLQLGAIPTTLNELGTRQMSAAAVLDDGTLLSPLADSVDWSVTSGPLTAISVGGIVSAGVVYVDSPARVQATFSGRGQVFDLMVLDTIPDNFGNFASDGLPDGWQVQYLGVSSTNGGPELDPDFDGIPNGLEYGLNLNPSLVSTMPVSTAVNGGVLEYHYQRSKAALNGGLHFQVEWSDTLQAASWNSVGVTEEVISDNGITQQIRAALPAANDGRRFARLRVW